MSNDDKTPEWMTEEWLRSDSTTWGWDQVAALARDHLRIRERVRVVEAERDFSDAARVLMAKERDRLRTEVVERDQRIDRLRGTLIACLRRGTEGFCADSVSDEFLAALPDELAAVRAARRKAETELAERTRERDREASEAAGYQKLAKEAAEAEKPGLLVLIVQHDGSEVRIFGPDREAEERFGETVARWWKLVQVTGDCLDAEEKTNKAEEQCAVLRRELDKARNERRENDVRADQMEAERDAARAESTALSADLARISDEMGLPPKIGPAPGELRRRLADGEAARAKAEKATRWLAETVAERDAARTEVERLRELLRGTEMGYEQAIAERDAAIRDRNEERERFNLLSQRCSAAEAARDRYREEVEQAQGEVEHALGGPRYSLMFAVQDLIRDRNEFAAAQVERCLEDYWNSSTMPFDDFVKIRAAELRKAAPAEACGGCGATSPKDAETKCRPDGDSCPGVELWHKAAPAAAPAESIGTIKELSRMVDGVITHATPPADLRQAGPRVKLPTRFWELLDEINMTGDQRMSRALSMLGVTIESMDVRPIAAERAGGAS